MFEILFFIFLIVEELIYKYTAQIGYYSSLLNSLPYFLLISAVIVFIGKLLKGSYGRHFLRIASFIIAFWYGACSIVRRFFGITLSFGATSMADQVVGGGFLSTCLDVIKSNWWIVIMVLVPFVLLCILINKIDIKDADVYDIFRQAAVMVMLYLLFVFSICYLDFNEYGLMQLYYSRMDNISNVEKFGVLPSFFIDLRKTVTGFKESFEVIEVEEEITEEVEEKFEIKRQVLDINFKKLAEEETNAIYKDMNAYFASESASYTNEYTGIFEGKNLIFIMGETFNGYMVSKELTPTLYKMIHEGFYFENYYTPTNLSTIGGEFQELTGLLPDPSVAMLSRVWRQGTNYYPFGLGTLFKELGYNTYAYHDHSYSFQDRNVYLKSLGFDNYMGCFNGLENKGLNCRIFPQSDDEMMSFTFDDYKDDEKFMVYYATVSGHMGWSFSSNAMSIKHKDEVKDLDLSPTVKAYVAANMEVELALTNLLKNLEESGKLADTVIVLAADHHPYGFGKDDYSKQLTLMRELSGNDELDRTFEMYHNNLIIYNSEIGPVNVKKVGNTIDVLPTVLNLFGIRYDSRLIIGKDLLSQGDGLVIFADGSWITDKGRYNRNQGTFVLNEDTGISSESTYLNRIQKIVRNRTLMSVNILKYDYYRYLQNKTLQPE